jgi:GntR family transcriptional repressor for pyruvate dehydrogenase complex
MRSPRVADVIARELRQRILSGALRDGESLPKQDELIAQFEAGLPAVREALRILELEGLISVRRGNVGGAVVHLPTLNEAAYMAALNIESRGGELRDVASALSRLEPMCAELCAERPDRAESVVPALEQSIALLQKQLDGEPVAFNEASHDFHRGLVEHCGNEAMRAAAGMLVVIWSAHERAYVERARIAGTFPGKEERRSSVEAHARILDAIRDGDGPAAARRAAAHAEAVHKYHFAADDREYVQATAVQSYYR